MRKNFGSQSWLYPMPVLIIGTYDKEGNPDVMNAAWGGMHDTNQIGVCIDPSHKTAENLQTTGCFTVSVGIAKYAVECDFAGIVSANKDADKFKKTGFHAEKSQFVNAPVISELPMTLECRLISYDASAGCAVGEIVNVSADESILDQEGKINPDKFVPICYDPVNHTYRELGKVIGNAFCDGKKLI